MNPKKEKKSKNKIPETLEECFDDLLKIFSPEQVEKLKNLTERELHRTHFGLGLWIRNKWFWNKPKGKLWETIDDKYFIQCGIRHLENWRKSAILADKDIKQYIREMRKFYRCHPDNMSSYIIRAFHKYLNGEDYKDLEIRG